MEIYAFTRAANSAKVEKNSVSSRKKKIFAKYIKIILIEPILIKKLRFLQLRDQREKLSIGMVFGLVDVTLHKKNK